MMRFCKTCGQSEPAHTRDDIGTCDRFVAPTRLDIQQRLRLMVIEAMFGRPVESQQDARTLVAAVDFLEEGDPPRGSGIWDPLSRTQWEG
jgi:hypothetical protein